MSVRVNLLPREAEDRERRRRAYAALAAGGVAFAAALGGLYWYQVSQLEDAEAQLAAAEAERDQLQGEVDELDAYADLQDRHEQAVGVVTAAMAGEASLAGVLQDVAVVMPDEATLTGLTVTIQPGDQNQEFNLGGPSLGRLNAQVEAFDRHAPGVERFMIEFDKVAAFFNVFVGSSTLDEDDVATFPIDAELGPEILTGRYLQGLPEELR